MPLSIATLAPHRLRWNSLAAAAFAALAAATSGCVSTPTKSEAPLAMGGAGGNTAVGADSRLQTCSETVGTIRLQDNTGGGGGNSPAGAHDSAGRILGILEGLARSSGQKSNAGPSAGVSLESLRLLIQQSGCFAILDRGADERDSIDEVNRAGRKTNNNVRDGANMEPGQEVAADYLLRASVLALGETESTGVNLGFLGKLAGGATVGKSVTEAKVQLVVVDIRSRVQVAVAQGVGSGSNTGLATNLLGRLGSGAGKVGVTSGSKTTAETIVLQAFADAYNKMVPAVQNYKAQVVRGGLGTGGTLTVQGSRRDTGAPPLAAPAVAAPR